MAIKQIMPMMGWYAEFHDLRVGQVYPEVTYRPIAGLALVTTPQGTTELQAITLEEGCRGGFKCGLLAGEHQFERIVHETELKDGIGRRSNTGAD